MKISQSIINTQNEVEIYLNVCVADFEAKTGLEVFMVHTSSRDTNGKFKVSFSIQAKIEDLPEKEES